MLSEERAIELARKYAQENEIAVGDLIHARFERDNWQRMEWEPRGDLWRVALAKILPPDALCEWPPGILFYVNAWTGEVSHSTMF